MWVGKKGDLLKVKVLRNTNFKLNNGKLSYDDIAEIEVEKSQLESRKLQFGDIILEKSGGSDTQAIGRVVLFDKKDDEIYSFSNFCSRIRVENKTELNPIYLWLILNKFYNDGGTEALQNGVRLLNIDFNGYKRIKIPLPPLDIQKKIVSEIEALEKQEQKAVEEVEKLRNEIETTFKTIKGKLKRLDEVCELKAGNFVKADNISKEFKPSLFPCYGGNGLRGYTETFTNEGLFSLVGRQGALCGNVHLVSGKFHATEHALVAYPKDDTNTLWLHYQLVFMNLNQYATGTAQPGLSVMNLNPIEISVPTISEQKKIVAEIEKIETKIAELQAQIADIPKQKEKILKKYLE